MVIKRQAKSWMKEAEFWKRKFEELQNNNDNSTKANKSETSPEDDDTDKKPLKKEVADGVKSPEAPLDTHEAPKQSGENLNATPEAKDLELEEKEPEKKEEETKTQFATGQCPDCEIDVIEGECPNCFHNFNE